MTTDLRLRRLLGPQGGGAVALVLGRSTAPVTPPLPDPAAGALRCVLAAPWSRTATLPAAMTGAAWRGAALQAAGWASPWAATAVGGARAVVLAPWHSASSTQGLLQAPWAATSAARGVVRSPWSATAGLAAQLAGGWHQAATGAGVLRSPWHPGQAAATATAARWQPPQRLAMRWAASAGAGRLSVQVTQAPWQAGRLVESIGGPVVVVTPPAPTACWVPEAGGSVDLVLRMALRRLADLVLACRRVAVRVVPIRRVYMITNTTSLKRVSDGQAIECFGFSLSLDRSSWAWGFSASLPASALPLLQPEVSGEPVELEASVNGVNFRLIARSISRDRVFGDQGVRVDGVGHTAVLAEPYSAESVFSAASALTAQQLLDQALPTGWTADWGLTAWSVPGGTWSHQGTPATAAVAIAAAGGGYVLPHPSALSIKVLPLYPVVPWSWGGVTPDIELPAAVVLRESIEWVDRPRYNGVYVSGTASGGVLRLVKRTGTAGDVLAPMVTDPLTTHVDAARQRGIAVLGDTGSQAWVTLGLPVLTETGIIQPGQFVRYVDGALARMGLSRAVRIDVTAGTGSRPAEVWQSIKLETHVS